VSEYREPAREPIVEIRFQLMGPVARAGLTLFMLVIVVVGVAHGLSQRRLENHLVGAFMTLLGTLGAWGIHQHARVTVTPAGAIEIQRMRRPLAIQRRTLAREDVRAVVVASKRGRSSDLHRVEFERTSGERVPVLDAWTGDRARVDACARQLCAALGLAEPAWQRDPAEL
jgi:hypothetical protein